jgi:hypothetical protein
MTTELITNVEVTDTYGGEANYSWVRRYEIRGLEGKSDLAIVRRVKREIGWEGVRCKTEQWGDEMIIRPVGVCQVCFIDFHTFGRAS